jgi:hypothetical protein
MLAQKKQPDSIWLFFNDLDSKSCDPAGTRTQDPYIKSVLLYQLSYGIISFWCAKGGAKIPLFPLKSNYSRNFFPICVVNFRLFCSQRLQHADHLRVKISHPSQFHGMHSLCFCIALMKFDNQTRFNP